MAHRISPEMVNFSRLAMCIIGPCTQMLRDILSVKVQPSKLRNYVTLASLKLNYEQKQQLNTGTVPDYANFDISFLYLLLRTPGMCRPPVTPPTNGWGIPPSSKYQVALGDDIERIRLMKNDICSHIKKPELTQKEFDDKLADLKAIAARIDAFLAPSTDYVKELDEMETEMMEEEVCQYYLDEIRNMKKKEQDVMEKLGEVKEYINSLHVTTNQINDKLDGTLQKMDTLSNEAKVQKDQEDAFLQRIQQDDKLFVESNASRFALSTLETAKVISIIGITGQGKTTLSRHIAIRFLKKGYRIVNIRSAKEFKTKCNPNERTIYLIDDAFGKHYKIQYEIDSWLRYIEELTEWSQEYDMYLIYTSQKVVWNECQSYLSSYTIFHSRNVIDLTVHDLKLTKQEKMQMLRMHLEAGKRDISEMMVQEVIEIETPIGFPYCCSSFSSNDELYALGRDYFRNTKTALQKEFQRISEIHIEKFCVLLSVMVLDNSFPSSFGNVLEMGIGDKVRNILLPLGIELDKNIAKLNKALKDLKGTYLQEQKNQVSFMHDAYIDAMCMVTSARNQSIILKNCSADFFHQYIRIDGDPNETNDDITIFTAASNEDLLRCIIRLLKGGELHLVFENPVFDNEEFIQQLTQRVDKDPELFTFMADQFSSEDENVVSILEYCIETTKQLLVTFAVFCFRKFQTLTSECRKKIETSINECLCVASRRGLLDAVEALLAVGANVAYKSPKSHNLDALLWSAAGGHSGILQLLIKRGANANTVDAKNQTVIHHLLNCSQSQDYFALVEMLIDNGADIDKTDMRGITVKELIMTKLNEKDAAFLEAKEMKRRADILEALKNYPYRKCHGGKNALHIVNESYMGDKATITAEDITRFVDTYTLLPKCRYGINQKDNKGKTPLFYAAESVNPLSLLLLCRAGADVNITDKNGNTALYHLMMKWNESNYENPVAIFNIFHFSRRCTPRCLLATERSRQFVAKVFVKLLKSIDGIRITTDDLWNFFEQYTPELLAMSDRVLKEALLDLSQSICSIGPTNWWLSLKPCFRNQSWLPAAAPSLQFLEEVDGVLKCSSENSRFSLDDVWHHFQDFFHDESEIRTFHDGSEIRPFDNTSKLVNYIHSNITNIYGASCFVLLAHGANTCEGRKKMNPEIYLQSSIKKKIYTSLSESVEIFRQK